MPSKGQHIYYRPLSSRQKARLKECLKKFQEARNLQAGYPCNADYNYSELYPFLEFSINNLGDPFSSSSYTINTHDFEREVLAFFAKLFHLKGKYQGHVTNCSTEGNLYGINTGYKKLANGIIYFSSAAHYSMKKVAELIRADYQIIPALENGEINYDILEKRISMNKTRPPIIVLTAGTTMTEATDDVVRVIAMLKKLRISNYYIHVDAALSGLILPFVKHPPKFDFTSNIHSLSISGHKFIGTPIPCSVVLTRQISHGPFVEYANLNDTTIGGSRNGTTVLFLWYAIQRLGKVKLKQWVQGCLKKTAYALKIFRKLGIPAWSNPNATTLVFPRPNEKIVKRWQLLVQNKLAHFVIKASTTKKFIDKIAHEIKKSK